MASRWPPVGSFFWGDPVATSSLLPTPAQTGEIRLALDTNIQWQWNGSAWVLYLDRSTFASATGLSTHIADVANPHATTKAQVGLGNADNTSDVNKPVSTAQQTALNLKANIASPTFTGTVGGVTSAMVGLGNADNTSDVNKPVSTAQQTALNLKAPIASPTFTGTVTLAADPSLALQAATKQYVDAVAAGLNPKAGVLCATTANITLSGEQTIDGILTSASRVLVKNQSTTSQNGLYVSGAGAWARTTDMDVWAEVPSAYIFVAQGSTLADTGWVCTSDAGGTIGSTAIAWTQFAGFGNVTDASVASAANIAYSKLASLPTGSILLGNAGVPTAAALSGDVTVGATGVTAIGALKVTNAMLASTSGALSVMLRDANQNVAANSFIYGFTTTATAGGTTTLTVASTNQQFFTGTLAQTVTLPVASTLVAGQRYLITNVSTGVVTVNSSGGNLVTTIAANTAAIIVCILNSGTTAASWSAAIPNLLTSGANSFVVRDANQNAAINNMTYGFASTATAGGTTTLTVASANQQFFTGTLAQTVTLPTTGIVAGQRYRIVNRSTGIVSVQSSGLNLILAVASNSDVTFTALVATPTTAAHWNGLAVVVDASATVSGVVNISAQSFGGAKTFKDGIAGVSNVLAYVPLHSTAFGLTARTGQGDSVTCGAGAFHASFDGTFLWVSNSGTNTISKVDPRTMTVSATVTIGSTPYFTTFDGANIWVCNYIANTLSKIRVSDNTVLISPSFSGGPYIIAFGGGDIWVATNGATQIKRILISDGTTVQATVTGLSSPEGIVFDGTHMWVSNQSASTVSKISIASNTIVATVATDANPARMVFDGVCVWVVCQNVSGTVKRIRISDNTVLSTISVGVNPYTIGWDGSYIWVGTTSGASRLFYINPLTEAVSTVVNSAGSFNDLSFDGNNIWGTVTASNLVRKFPLIR